MSQKNQKIPRLGVRRWLVTSSLLLVAISAQGPTGGQAVEKPPSPTQKKEENKQRESIPRAASQTSSPTMKTTPDRAANRVEVHFIDGSKLKLILLDERIELNTRYGILQIPVRDIERIEIAFRLPDDVARRIETALADLGKEDFHRREAASDDLKKLGERAYPALLKAVKSSDAEVSRRARDLLSRLQDQVPPERLQFRSQDIVYTAESKNPGRIAALALRVHTSQFGEQQLKLADVREIRSPSLNPPEPTNVLPDPGNLNSYQAQTGKVFSFRVTGMIGSGPVWGTDTYTLDSNLAAAAVHAGILKLGQTGTVRVKIQPPQAGYTSSSRNGVTSSAYGLFPGSFEFVRDPAGLDR